MRVVRAGMIERGGPNKGYRWVQGYTFQDEHKTISYPWLTFREMQQEAKRRGIKMSHVARLVPEMERRS